jgi:hemolysin III
VAVSKETPDPLHIPLGELKGTPHEDDFRPSWRGWIHTGVLPFVIAAGIVLIVVSEGWLAKTASAIFFASSVLLFGNSALYHRFRWKPFAKKLLKRIDHANIFLLIAGSYTPICFSAMESGSGLVLLIVIWSIAVLGISFRIFWIGAPRWLYVPIYLAMGWAAVFYIPDLFAVNFVAMTLIVIGGLFYSVGAVIYGLKRPNPIPKHFGFHEIFHALTVVAFICHWTAALIIGLDPLPSSLSGLA